ncbi:hypothetical protein CURTO8I2_80124 [Curtobacterium sp. 8I-2]|nr:hypothetical protein CURTO8I2_80124 [Curtobacterium sp. 8I-2]
MYGFAPSIPPIVFATVVSNAPSPRATMLKILMVPPRRTDLRCRTLPVTPYAEGRAPARDGRLSGPSSIVVAHRLDARPGRSRDAGGPRASAVVAHALVAPSPLGSAHVGAARRCCCWRRPPRSGASVLRRRGRGDRELARPLHPGMCDRVRRGRSVEEGSHHAVEAVLARAPTDPGRGTARGAGPAAAHRGRRRVVVAARRGVRRAARARSGSLGRCPPRSSTSDECVRDGVR